MGIPCRSVRRHSGTPPPAIRPTIGTRDDAVAPGRSAWQRAANAERGHDGGARRRPRPARQLRVRTVGARGPGAVGPLWTQRHSHPPRQRARGLAASSTARCCSCWRSPRCSRSSSAQAIIIGVILVVSVGLGFVNEYRAERAPRRLHSSVHHTAVVLRDGPSSSVDVTDLVPGDVVRLALGEVVPADVRLIEVNGLECNESVLTGESMTAEKSHRTGRRQTPHSRTRPTWRSWGRSSARARHRGRVRDRGRRAVRPDRGRPRRAPARDRLPGGAAPVLLSAAVGGGGLTVIILVDQPAAAPAPDRLAAVRPGDRRRASRRSCSPPWSAPAWPPGRGDWPGCKVLVKRLVCIEDLGDIDVLITDKTGTLTDGHITFPRRRGSGRGARMRCCARPAGHRRRPASRSAGRRQRHWTPRCGESAAARPRHRRA